jgi:hypothetical protein
VSSTEIRPDLDQPDTGSPDDHSHVAKKADIMRALVEGGKVKALCGVEFEPVRDPSRFPVCPTCAKLLEGVSGSN